jgi:chromosome segregation ATPase
MYLFKKSSREIKPASTSSSKDDTHSTTIEDERRRVLPNQSFKSTTYALGTILPEGNVNTRSDDVMNNKGAKDEIFSSVDARKFKKSLDELKKRYDKKFKELTASMVEKAEESVKLHSAIKDREKQVKTLKQENESLKAENEKLKKELQDLQNTKKDSDYIISELQRRLQSLSYCLEEMAKENLSLTDKLKILSPKVEKKNVTNVSLRSKEDDDLIIKQSSLINELQSKVEYLEEEVKNLQLELETRKSRIKMLEDEVRNQSQQNQALVENIDQYEEQIAHLERKMKDNLKKEAKRRHKVEYDLVRYKKKVRELKFFLDEKEEDDFLSDSSNESDADSDNDNDNDKEQKQNKHRQNLTPKPPNAPTTTTITTTVTYSNSKNNDVQGNKLSSSPPSSNPAINNNNNNNNNNK